MLIYKSLILNTDTKQCFINDKEIFLTKKEYCLLTFLLSNINHVYSREELHNNVFPNTSCNLRAIDMIVFRLRKKLKEYSNNILTRFGFGYSFSTEI